MKAILATGALAALLALPGAMAYVSTGDATGTLAPYLPPEAGTLPTFYVGDDGSLWQESNGCAGLQAEPGEDEVCGAFDADTLLVESPL